MEEPSLYERVRSEPAIARRRGRFDRLRQNAIRPRQIRYSLDRSDVGQQLDTQRVLGTEQRDRTRDQIDPGRPIAAEERAPPRGPEELGAVTSQLVRVIVRWRERRSVPIGLLEVIAEDLLELEDSFARLLFEPLDMELVQPGSDPFRDGVVRRVADHEMPEAKGALSGEHRAIRANQLLADECGQRRGHVHSGSEPGDGGLVKHLSLDRRGLDHRALIGAQLIEPRGEQCLDRGGHRERGQISGCGPALVLTDEETVVDQHREHLLDEERIALCCARDAELDLSGQLRFAYEVGDELRALGVGERLEEDRGRVELSAAPGRPNLEELWSRQAQQQDRSSSRPLGQLLDEVVEGLLAPVHIVEDDDQRHVGGDRLEQAADGVEALVDSDLGVAEADQLPDSLSDERSVFVVQELGEARFGVIGSIRVVQVRQLLDHLEQWPERDAFAVRETPASHDESSSREVGEELVHEAGLADAGQTEDREQLTGAVPDRLLECVVKAPPLAFTTDHRRDEPAIPAARCLRRSPCRLVEDDVARLRGLCEPSGHAEGLACRASVECGGPSSGHDGAGAHADACLDASELVLPVRADAAPNRFCHANGPCRIVLVHDWQPERRADRVPRDGLDLALVRFDDRGHLVEHQPEQLSQNLGIDPFVRVGRQAELDVNDAHGLSLRAPAGLRSRARGCLLRRLGGGPVRPLDVQGGVLSENRLLELA